MTWDPGFTRRSAMFSPLAQTASLLEACADWPQRRVLQSLVDAEGVVNARGIPLRLVAPCPASEGYEAAIATRGEVATREGQWHDLFNVLAWLAYPRTKAALNLRHVEAVRETLNEGACNRGRVQDALTVFDESGAVFVSADEALIEDLRAFRWKDLFWTKRRRVVELTRVFVFGHALFEKALAPYVGMTAHALPLLVDTVFTAESPQRQVQIVDELVSGRIAALTSPRALSPLPLLGVPGWWPENERESFYDNTDYFRPGRRRS